MDRDNPVRGASALLAFRAENVRSFRSDLELTLVATSIAEPEAVQWLAWREGGSPVGVLPVAGVFGANASGKTNVLKAMASMRDHVLYSFRASDPTGGIRSRQPFQLDPKAMQEPSTYEIDFILNGVRHEYGFVVDNTRVIEEWATRYPHGRASMMFRREEDEVRFGAREPSRTRAAADLLRSNALFLSTAASTNSPSLLPLYRWFNENLLLAEAGGRVLRQLATARLLESESQRPGVLSLLRAADLGVTDVKRQDLTPVMRERIRKVMQVVAVDENLIETGEKQLADAIEGLDVRLLHQGDKGAAELKIEDESLGTLVWFGLVGPVIESLARGAVLLVDEIDASLHPALVAQLIQLYQSSETNIRNAQLIFNSHDITVLGDSVGERLLGRDQVWFTEKDTSGSSRLYALSDFDPRKYEAVGKRYLAGRYGAVPLLSSEDFAAIAAAVSNGDKS